MEPKYSISKSDQFVIDNYNQAPVFSSFFPGIAGKFGCPMWVFYCNRGQCITSAGVQDKDGAILEFQPANKAYRLVAQTGFRTFVKIDNKFYEPFKGSAQMQIGPEQLTIVEENKKLKLKVEVTYFTVANESFPALARSLKITNLSNKKRKIELIDGLPNIVPFGFVDDLLKRLSTTIQAWVVVENLANQAPFYKLKVNPADVSETKGIDKGNFYLPYCPQGHVKLIVDPQVVFGPNLSLEIPENFFKAKTFKIPSKQNKQGIMPAAMAYKKFELKAKADFKLYSLIGQSDSLKLLNKLKKKISKQKFFLDKLEENKKLIAEICNLAETKSSNKSFDLYARQTYLDNIMRGGLPVSLGDKLLYLYYRKHGDMERDYNNFRLNPTYLSQGNGNYRDINQNRRCDIFFNPEVAEDNIVRFFNLIQLDGFNPLVVLGSKFVIKSASQAKNILAKHLKSQSDKLIEALINPFIIGDFLKNLEEAGFSYRTKREELVKELLSVAQAEEEAHHGEGFWIDHGFYNTDLLESFASIFPDKLKELLFKRKTFTFFDNDHIVHPRKHKYTLNNGQVRQYVSVQADSEKQAQIHYRQTQKNVVRTNNGRGQPYYTTLIAKLFCLIANKAVSFDAQGIGLEMEAEKPDWYDALNGLPGLLGSSLSESLELKRICTYTRDQLSGQEEIILPVEVKNLIDQIDKLLSSNLESFDYWDKSYTAKEAYREKIRLGLSGNEEELKADKAKEFLTNIIKKCDLGFKKCLKKYKNYYTYFINEVTNYEQTSDGIKVKAFKQTPLPLFLEGFVHALKVEQDKEIPQLVKNSPLYDKKLKRYKVNASLKTASLEIGRCKVFTPGWLENESIWLHMEYKYLLELLKAGFYRQFFADLKNCLIAFNDPQVYKRSVLENSSFLVSSANPNPQNHGRGFVARLSGACAEFLDMWVIMTTGKKMFALNHEEKLTFELTPKLPGWLFDKAGEFSFKLLGSIDVTYVNKKKKDTFASNVKVVSYQLTLADNKKVEIKNSTIKEPLASLIRDRKVRQIIVTLS